MTAPPLAITPRHATPDELRTLPTQYRVLTLEIDRAALAARAMAAAAGCPCCAGGTCCAGCGCCAGCECGLLPITISSEEPCDRWYGTEILGHKKGEIDLSRASDGLPFCLEHDCDDQLGLVEDVTLGTDARLHGMVRFGNHPDALWVQKDMEAGIRKNVSVGYCVNAMVLTETKGGLDSYRITGWTPLEVSTVAVPADPTVGVGRSADRAAFPVALTIPVPQPPLAGAQERTMPEPTVETPKAPTIEELRAAEQTRSRDILTLCSEHELAIAQATDFIGRGLTRDQTAHEILTLKRAKIVKPAVAAVSGMHDRAGDQPFETLGDFLHTVIRSSRRSATVDPRLMVERALGMNEGTPADGGFAVPPEFAAEIVKNSWATGKVLARVRKIPMTSNVMKINVIQEDSRATGSRYGGVQFFWAGEGQAGTPKRPKLRQLELNLAKLIGLWYLTDELMEDAPAMQAEANTAFQNELTFMLEDAYFNGPGAGSPLGFLNSGAVVSVAIEAAQTIANSAASFAKNFAKMYAAMPAALLDDACWFINQEIWPNLMTATLGGASAVVPVFMPPGLLSSAPYGSIYGRPVVPVEYAAAQGTPGDIVFAALSQYLVGDRGGAKTAASMHVAFLTDEQCFRITYRTDGKPVWNKPLTPYKGSQNQSPFVTLAVRA